MEEKICNQSGGNYLCADMEAGSLPSFVEKAISVVDEPHLKDMLFLSTLSACGYAMPHVKMLHGKKKHTYYPNLMTLIVAGPASGKNVMTCAEQLLDPIEKRLEMQHRIVFIPANSSSAAFHELFHANGGQGFILATEIDEMSKIWKKDYCDYSEFLRLAAEHETPRRARVKPGGGVVPVKSVKPRLSILMSGTPGQLKPLLGSRENGLASRFQPYIVTDVTDFDESVVKGCDHYEPNDMEVVFAELSEELLARWEWLSAQDHDCIWALTPEQEDILANVGTECYRTLFHEENYTESGKRLGMPISFAANYKRTIVTVKRIGMILSVMRMGMGKSTPSVSRAATISADAGNPLLHRKRSQSSQKGRNHWSPPDSRCPVSGEEFNAVSGEELQEVLYCGEEDFNTMLVLFERLLLHSAKMALMLPEEEEGMAMNIAERTNSAEKAAEAFLDMVPEKFTYAYAKECGAKVGMSERSVSNHLEMALKKKQIVRVKRGMYKKIG